MSPVSQKDADLVAVLNKPNSLMLRLSLCICCSSSSFCLGSFYFNAHLRLCERTHPIASINEIAKFSPSISSLFP